jgi:hypothetical protein
MLFSAAMADKRIKRIVILANSFMSGRRCVAGKELDASRNPAQWIRLVTSDSGGLREKDVREINLLDIVDFPILHPAPNGCHSENWIIAEGAKWQSAGCFPADNIAALLDNPPTLWENGHHPSNDRMPPDVANKQPNSLALIKPDALRSLKSSFGKWRAIFEYRGVSYNMAITDTKSSSLPISKMSCLCVSVTGEAHKETGDHYKLVAGIINAR